MSAIDNHQAAEIIFERSNARARLPILHPKIGAPMVDVRHLYHDTGCLTYDPALGETGICRSRITYVDGDKGILLYRGYPIAELVEQCSYLEICWLLLNGELPSAGELATLTHAITRHARVNEQLLAIYGGFRRDSHPMAVMCGVV
ncbi:MAG: citrate (Si)-synthase, partial [Alphaproteobacteria bacterium]|nr:citrate (Si)-synthase [Alphaproteobacteria bacterium]